MKHVYLSPHLDDAALSCGGAIFHYAAAGQQVLVVTVFAQEADQDLGLSPFALEQHRSWGSPPQPVGLRRAEDVAALTRLGATASHLKFLDAVYRADSTKRWLYTDLARLYGEVQPGDPMAGPGMTGLVAKLAELIPLADGLQVCAPLGVGHHVDHLVVRRAAQSLQALGYRLALYEDYPYAEQESAVQAALDAVEAGAGDWHPQVLPLDALEVAAKVSALAYYRTQLPVLFGGGEAMPNRVWAFASSRSPEVMLAERIWWPA